jgi:SAM-dependent methyltransferase
MALLVRGILHAVSSGTTAEAWEAHAKSWARWARTPSHDYHYERLNLPQFLRLLPGPGRLTIDLACGEGRLGRALATRGHSLVGVDSSPTLARLAREAGGYREVLEAVAGSVPLRDGCADLVTIFMGLQDMDDLDAPIREAARLLEDGGRLCVAVPHPFAEVARARPTTPGYYHAHRYADVIERDGITMTFESWYRPLSAYTEALERANFAIEAMREPIPDDGAVTAAPALAKWREEPIFLHIRQACSPSRGARRQARTAQRFSDLLRGRRP